MVCDWLVALSITIGCSKIGQAWIFHAVLGNPMLGQC